MAKISSVISILPIFLWGCNTSPNDVSGDDNKKLLAQTDSIALYREIIFTQKMIMIFWNVPYLSRTKQRVSKLRF